MPNSSISNNTVPPPPPPPPPANPGSSSSSSGAVVNNTNNNPRSNMRTYLQALEWAQRDMPHRTRTDELLHDIINLADEAARLALGENTDETEDEDFM